MTRDGTPDLLLRQNPTGTTPGFFHLWVMTEQGTVASGVNVSDLSMDWTLVNVVDRNQDDNPDMLLRHGPTGFLHTWLMTAQGTVASGLNVSSLGLDWTIQPEADGPASALLTAHQGASALPIPALARFGLAPASEVPGRETSFPWVRVVNQGGGLRPTLVAAGGDPTDSEPGSTASEMGTPTPGSKRRIPDPPVPGLKPGEQQRAPIPYVPRGKGDPSRPVPDRPIP